MDKKKEVDLLNLQIIVITIYIISLIISIYITTVDKNNIINATKKYPNTKPLSIFNRALIVILSLLFLYISYENRKLGIKKGKDPNLFNLQVMASEISLLSTIIVLYVVIKSLGSNYTITSGISNPNL